MTCNPRSAIEGSEHMQVGLGQCRCAVNMMRGLQVCGFGCCQHVGSHLPHGCDGPAFWYVSTVLQKGARHGLLLMCLRTSNCRPCSASGCVVAVALRDLKCNFQECESWRGEGGACACCMPAIAKLCCTFRMLVWLWL